MTRMALLFSAVAWSCQSSANSGGGGPPSSEAQARASSLKAQVLSGDNKPLRLDLPNLNGTELANDRVSFTRSVQMPPAEWVQRLGSFRIRVKTVLSWGKRDSGVTDEHVWHQAENGDFSVRHLSNLGSKGAGSVEWRKVGERMVVRNQKGQWREKPVRAEQQDEQPQLVLSNLGELLALFDSVHLTFNRPVTVANRAASAYRVTWAKSTPPAPGRLLGDDFQPEQLSGTLTVDTQTGVLLAAELKASLWALPMPPPKAVIPSAAVPPTGKIALTLTLQETTDAIGDRAFVVDLPKAIPEITRIRPPSSPLSFWEPAKGSSAKDNEDEE